MDTLLPDLRLLIQTCSVVLLLFFLHLEYVTIDCFTFNTILCWWLTCSDVDCQFSVALFDVVCWYIILNTTTMEVPTQVRYCSVGDLQFDCGQWCTFFVTEGLSFITYTFCSHSSAGGEVMEFCCPVVCSGCSLFMHCCCAIWFTFGRFAVITTLFDFVVTLHLLWPVAGVFTWYSQIFLITITAWLIFYTIVVLLVIE